VNNNLKYFDLLIIINMENIKRKRDDDDENLIKRIKSETVGLNGPYKLIRLNGIDKTIYLFGEKHAENYCKEWIDAQPENIISFVNFLINVLKLTIHKNIFVDIFIEIIGFSNKQYDLEGENLYTGKSDTISSIYKRFKNCIQTSTRNECNGFRMHWADSRNTKQHTFIKFMNFIQDMIFAYEQSKKVSVITLLCNKLENEVVKEYFENVIIRESYIDFSKFMISYIVEDIDIVKKEYEQVDDFYKVHIKSFFTIQIQSLIIERYEIYRKRIKLLYKFLFLKRSLLETTKLYNLLRNIALNPVNVALEANVMNIYTICRILKKYNIERLPTETNLEYESRIQLDPSRIYNPQPDSSNNIIFYGGEKHIGVISDFFSTVPTFTKTIISESDENTNCLKLEPDTEFFGNKIEDIVFLGEEEKI
jgi:hypothetical protein